MARDIYALLPNISWRGLPFPVESLETEFAHAHAEHYFVYKNGCHIEALGRNAFCFVLRIPFHNGIIAAPGESWAGQILYPDMFRSVLAALLDSSTGEFRHPDLGVVNCKARSVSWGYRSNVARDGVTIDVKLFETTDNGDDINAAIANQAPIAAAISSADQLDVALAAAKNVPTAKEAAIPPTFIERIGQAFGDRFKAAGNNFPELVNDDQSFGDMTRAYQDGTGTLSPIRKKTEDLGYALDRRDDVNDWPLRQAHEDMRACLFNLNENPFANGKNLQGHTVETGTTLPLLAIKLNTTTSSLIQLNPSLVSQPRVPAGTKVLFSASL